MTAFDILRMLMTREMTTAQIQNVTLDYWTKTHIGELMKRLEHEDKVRLTNHGWAITPKGRESIKISEKTRVFTPYVPPTYPRRKGSLWIQQAPSCVADKLIYPKDRK